MRATFVRSTVAHALITGIDTSEALAQPGVVAVLTVADMTDLPDQAPPEPVPEGAPPAEGPMPLGGVVGGAAAGGGPGAVRRRAGRARAHRHHLPGRGRRRAGQRGLRAAARGGVRSRRPSRARACCSPTRAPTCASRAVGEVSDDSIFDGCEVIVEGDVVNQRVACLPMEGRSTAAAWVNGKLTVWASTQNAQLARLILTAIGLPPDAIRVVAPDVGGGFGAKIGIDRESIIVAWAAKHTGRPVRWVETRNENLVGDDPGPRAAAPHQDRRQQGRAHQGLPARRHPGHRRVPADVAASCRC